MSESSKQIILFGVLGMILLGLVGCGENSVDPKDEAAKKAQAAKAGGAKPKSKLPEDFQ